MSMNTSTFNIYSLLKNGELLEQAKIEETTDSYRLTVNPLPSVIHHMDSYLSELFNLMMTYEKENPYNGEDKNYNTKRFQYMNDEFIEATIFHRVLMRKGSYFYVCQKSDRGTRFLLYAMNRVHHGSDSLGCEMRQPFIADELKEMKKILSEQPLGVAFVDFNPRLIEINSLYFL